MLKQRIITAACMLAVLLPALFAEPVWPFALLSLLLIGAAAWEWGRLNGLPGTASLALGALMTTAGVAMLAHAAPAIHVVPVALWWSAALAWSVGGALALRLGVVRWSLLPQWLRLLLGVVLLGVAWQALAQARAIGVNFLLSVLALVWAADIAAYFGGRALGRRKLAPSISPGKSWEGVWSGMLGVAILALAWIAFDRLTQQGVPSLYSMLLERLGAVAMAAALVMLVALCVVGDLFESLVKRSAGAKDSSGLLPGHGGVLDRIDALLPVFPLALALYLL